MVRQPDRMKQEKNDTNSPDVIIFGSGTCARKIADNLEADGVCTWLVDENDMPAVLPDDGNASGRRLTATLNRCRGFPGSFDLELNSGPNPVHTTARAIVVAEDCRRRPNLTPYGLDSGPRVLDIFALESMLAATDGSLPFDAAATVAFVCGWQADCQADVSLRMLDACCRVQQQSGGGVYFLTGDLKVAADGAQQRLLDAQKAGVIFLKFEDEFPTLTAVNDQRFGVSGMDQLSGTAFDLDADWIVVDEVIQPAPHLEMLARRLGIDRDASGFAQGDNVRRMSNATNRHGVFVAGGGRGPLSASDQLADADQVSLEVLTFLRGADEDARPAAVVNNGRCARCLTCHRSCPHLAIQIVPRITIVPQACQGCGICLASCPARAIEMDDLNIDDCLEAPVQSLSQAMPDKPPSARITVLGCSRSAGRAFALTRLSGARLATGIRFVEVPCGGTIATRHILAAFEAGADGVMLCPCHTDNCQSQIGSKVVRQRAESTRDLLQASGVDVKCLRISPLAANMGIEFAHLVNAFADELEEDIVPRSAAAQ